MRYRAIWLSALRLASTQLAVDTHRLLPQRAQRVHHRARATEKRFPFRMKTPLRIARKLPSPTPDRDSISKIESPPRFASIRFRSKPPKFGAAFRAVPQEL